VKAPIDLLIQIQEIALRGVWKRGVDGWLHGWRKEDGRRAVLTCHFYIYQSFDNIQVIITDFERGGTRRQLRSSVKTSDFWL